jgi:hypothetical protein
MSYFTSAFISFDTLYFSNTQTFYDAEYIFLLFLHIFRILAVLHHNIYCMLEIFLYMFTIKLTFRILQLEFKGYAIISPSPRPNVYPCRQPMRSFPGFLALLHGLAILQYLSSSLDSQSYETACNHSSAEVPELTMLIS